MEGEHRLRRVLGPIQLTSLGIGCIIGAGIFVVTGKVAHDTTGPALIVSFIIAGIACVFAALCYAEFAAMAPVAGSAYTYAYATLGELFAWIIGWDLVLEYTVASAAVAQGWSSYFQSFIGLFGWEIPHSLGTTPIVVVKGHAVLSGALINLPAVAIGIIITALLVKGIRESATSNAAMVILKVAVVVFVVVVGAFFVDPRNWWQFGGFAPYGWSGLSLFGKPILGKVGPNNMPVGMLAGAALVFFAYIGFDSVSTHAEEARNPQRDVPIGIIGSLAICTILYIAVAAVLTGMVPYNKLDPHAGVAVAFSQVGLPWAKYLISFGAVAGITSVLLVLMLSQPRVLLAMARDGLLPRGFFGAVHPKFRTPWKSTILTGTVVTAFAALLPLDVLMGLVNIGTLLAFVIVCLAVLVMRKTHPEANRPFRCPAVPFIPILGVLFCLILMFSLPSENWLRLFVWLAIGLAIYWFYGRHHSVMACQREYEAKKNEPTQAHVE
ncbi:MAG: amino acid permease [Armatimonadetes bacterium]|nr:amino acid permease [Armatimonadota bacterium]